MVLNPKGKLVFNKQLPKKFGAFQKLSIQRVKYYAKFTLLFSNNNVSLSSALRFSPSKYVEGATKH